MGEFVPTFQKSPSQGHIHVFQYGALYVAKVQRQRVYFSFPGFPPVVWPPPGIWLGCITWTPHQSLGVDSTWPPRIVTILDPPFK
jgi:hypothetical protein